MTNAELIEWLARVYETRQPWEIPQELIDKFRAQVDHWFNRILIPVRWNFDTECGQPFNDQPSMADHTKDRGELLMLSETSEQLGRLLYSKHRAVHDWFGHLIPDQPFGGEGECRSFCAHLDQYTPDVLPIVFSDVVLGNCYWQHFGHKWAAGEKWVHAPDLIPVVVKHFRTVPAQAA